MPVSTWLTADWPVSTWFTADWPISTCLLLIGPSVQEILHVKLTYSIDTPMHGSRI